MAPDHLWREIIWKGDPGVVPIAQGAIHVWRAFVGHSEALLTVLAAILDDDERERAERMRFGRDSRRFIASHAATRIVLSHYLLESPESLQIEIGKWGQPFLPGQSGPEGLRYSLSHSGDYALVAVSRGADVGVDVELHRDDFPIDEVVNHFFDAEETAAIKALPRDRRAHAFFDAWVSKEARLKACGLGLAALEQTDGLCRSNLLSSWTVRMLDMGAGYSAAVAAEGPEKEISLFSMRLWDQ